MDSNQPVPTFDWYAATIDDDPLAIANTLADALGAELRDARGLHGYAASLELVRDGDTIARVLFGRWADDDGRLTLQLEGAAAPHAWASGDDAPRFAELVREHWPAQHYVTRVDVAFDFKDDPDAWEQLHQLAVDVADQLEDGTPRSRPIKLGTVGDWLRPGAPNGRTLYVGSTQSPVMARLYEKGKQLRIAFPDQADKFPEGWVRLELQLRPEKDARHRLARMEPGAMWGSSRWARQLHAAVFATQLQPVQMGKNQPPDDARAWHYLVKQYGPLLLRQHAQLVAKLAEGASADPGALSELAWVELGRRLGAELG